MRWIGGLGVLGALLGMVSVTARAQQSRSVFAVRIDSLSGAPASIRAIVHGALLAEGYPVREVSACDCLVSTEPVIRDGSAPMELRVHILKPPGRIRVLVVIQAFVGASVSTVATESRRSEASVPRVVIESFERLKIAIGRARVPPTL